MGVLGIAIWAALGALTGTASRPLTRRLTTKPLHTERGTPPLALEAATAALFGALAWRIGPQPQLLAYSWLAAISVPLAAVDWISHRLPNRLLLPGYAAFIALIGLSAALHHNANPLLRSLTGMAVLLTFYGALYTLFPGQLGGGDCKLAGLLGLALGPSGWTALLTGTLLGWVYAALSLVIHRTTHRATREHIALGPFLLAGAFTTLLLTLPAAT